MRTALNRHNHSVVMRQKASAAHQNAAGNWTPESVASTASTLIHQNAIRSPTFLSDAPRLHKIPVRTDDVPLLTDDYAPVDTMVF
jgi:hypothetical protein